MLYTLTQEFNKSIASMMITFILVFIVTQIQNVPESYEEEFNDALQTREKYRIKTA
jgi:hypothetical protein